MLRMYQHFCVAETDTFLLQIRSIFSNNVARCTKNIIGQCGVLIRACTVDVAVSYRYCCIFNFS